MNTESSRSHSLVQFTVQQRNTETGSSKTGRLYLVDLAGSEKVGKTGASGQTLEEAKKINKSLSALGMVINALTDGKSSHVPYRDSKLTRILQESLGGNSRTTLIVNCSPCAYNAEETLSTLRFGVRAKSIRNNARVNAELSPSELREMLRQAQAQAARYKAQSARLSSELTAWRAGESVPEAQWTMLLSGGECAREEAPVVEPADGRELRVELAALRAQEATLISQNRALEAELSDARLRIDELVFEARDAREQADLLRTQSSTLEHAARPSARTTREERVAAMLEQLGSVSGIDTLLGLVGRLEAAVKGGDVPLSLDELHELREGIVHGQVALSEQTHAARVAMQERTVLEQQKHALSERNTALQRRYDLITNQIGALENGLRVGDEGGAQLAALREMLEEHTTARELNTSTEVTHLEQLLVIRSEETAGLTRSLDDLRASHAEQRKAMELLTASFGGGSSDAGAVQRLVDASFQMERARELVTLRLREYERLKEQMMQGLRERSERIVEMDMELEEMQDQYRLLLQSLNLRVQQRKMGVLERRLEQLTSVQRRLVEQNQTLKRDVSLAERRLAARTERLEELEAELEAASEDEMPAAPFARIAKPLRGGGQSPPRASRWFFASK